MSQQYSQTQQSDYLSQSGDEIAIIGMAGRFPGANDVEQFWQNLREGTESISFFSDQELKSEGIDPELIKHPNYVKAQGIIEGIELFDAGFFDYSPKEAELIDPQHRLFLECAWQAFEHAGYDPFTYGKRIGVFAGANINTYALYNLYSKLFISNDIDLYQIMLGNDRDFLTTRVSYKLNLRGPSVNIQTACSTSLVAIHFACQSILNGECDTALAGGVSIRVPQKSGHLYQYGMIHSPDGHCRAFDAESQGSTGGNGVGIIVLKLLEKAITDRDNILAVIKGSAINNDGSLKVGFTGPSVSGQADVIKDALAIAQVDPNSISYIEAHGTGTSLGDPVEVSALIEAFSDRSSKERSEDRKQYCALGSVKTNIGHLDAAAGVAGLIKTIQMLRYNLIPPSLHFKKPNPQINFADSPFYVNSHLFDWQSKGGGPLRAGVSSFGIGGTNAHVVLEQAPRQPQSEKTQASQLLLLSAKTETALKAMTANLATHLRKENNLDLADVAYTLQVGRKDFDHRRILVCRDISDALLKLDTLEPNHVLTGFRSSTNRSISFLFPGQGSQYLNMGEELYKHESFFRKQVDSASEILKVDTGIDIRNWLYPNIGDESEYSQKELDLKQTYFAQISLFIIEYSLAKLWIGWGIKPESMLGHSIGEYVAACIAGVFSLEDALKLVAERGRLMQEMPAGAMLSIAITEEQLLPILNNHLSLAAVNGSDRCVASGDIDAIEQLHHQLSEIGVSSKLLHTSHAFHSSMMEPIIQTYSEIVGRVRLAPPQIPFISNVTGEWITASEATSKEYWATHLRRTVRFHDGICKLLENPNRIMLEVGPSTSLTSLARLNRNKSKDHVFLSSLPHPNEDKSDQETILKSAGELWIEGVSIDWRSLQSNKNRYRVPLPAYPFERSRYWIEHNSTFPVNHDLKQLTQNKSDVSDWFYVPIWKQAAHLSVNHAHTYEHKQEWILFADSCEISNELSKQLELYGEDVIKIFPGEDFSRIDKHSYSINPNKSDNYSALVRALISQGKSLKRIIHAWNITPVKAVKDNSSNQSDYGDDLVMYAFYSPTYLAKAIGEVDIAYPISLWIISSDMQSVVGESVIYSEKATLLGPCMVIPQEYPYISCRSIDVTIANLQQGNYSKREYGQLINHILAELYSDSSDRVVAYRGNRRWIRTFESVRIDTEKNGSSLLREGGVYLITGGMGGVGLEIAEYLARTYKAKLILTGRRTFPPRTEWLQWLSANQNGNNVSSIIRKLIAIEELGSEVLICQADVTNHEQMQQVVTNTCDRFGKLNGVIHSAGISGGGMIQLKTSESSSEVLAPKVVGARVLDSILNDTSLDFIALFSSVNGITGAPGQVDYCAANAFLDSFANKRVSNSKPLILSISWDEWQGIGMAAKKLTTSQLISEMEGMLSSQAVEAFDRVLRTNVSRQIVVCPKDLNHVIDQYSSAAIGKELLQTTGLINSKPTTLHLRPELRSIFAPPGNEEERILAEIWQEYLGIEQIGVDDNYFELGGDSMVAIQIHSKMMEAGWSVTLPQLFKYQTIRSLARKLSPVESHHCLPFSMILNDNRMNISDEIEDAYPLTMLQNGMLFHSQNRPETAIYHGIVSIRLEAELNVNALQQSIDIIANRHPILRTSFDLINFKEPVQLVHREVKVELGVEDLTHLPDDDQTIAIREWINAEKLRHFDWTIPPLIRFTVHRCTASSFQLTFTAHHSVIDGWSNSLVLSQLSEVYDRLLQGKKYNSEPPLASSFNDYVYLEQKVLASEEASHYWKNRLIDSTATIFPRINKSDDKLINDQFGNVEIKVQSKVTAKLLELSGSISIPLKNILLTSYLKVLSVLSGKKDILTGLVMNTRPEVNDGDLIVGLFVNTIPFRLTLNSGSWIELARQVFEAERELLPYRYYPLAQIQIDSKQQKLFETCFNFTHFHIFQSQPIPDSLKILSTFNVSETSLALMVNYNLDPLSSDLYLSIDYDALEFNETQIKSIASYYINVLEEIAFNPSNSYELFTVLSQDERRMLLDENNYTEREIPNNGLMHNLFEAQVENIPDAIAVTFEDQQLSYRELNNRSNQLGNYLRRIGISPDSVAAINIERSVEMLIGILGILKAGGAYLPITNNLPPERIDYMLKDSGAILLLSQSSDRRDYAVKQVVYIDDEWNSIQSESAVNLSKSINWGNLAYVIYTSGSTGKPKGVQITHQSVSNLVLSMLLRPGMSNQDILSSLTSISFDIAVLELFLPIIAGGRLNIIDNEKIMEEGTLIENLMDAGTTILQATPSAWQLILSKGIPISYGLKVLCGGEPLSRSLASRLMDVSDSVWNLYAPTETTIYSTANHIEFADDSMTIGRAINNTQIYILDDCLIPVPIGTSGNLYISGLGLARGYIDQSEMTAERFIPAIYSEIPGARMYQTGDLSRFLPDGKIEFIGRIDNQVKVRGFRIELEEIEAILGEHEAVREIAVAVIEDMQGQNSLTAYVVLDDENSYEPRVLNEYLKNRLPSYMIPSSFILLDRLPLTPNGKVDRNALVNTDGERLMPLVEYVAPATAIERSLAEIGAEILGVSQIGIYDNFFDLGIHSLTAARFTYRINHIFNLNLSTRSIFEEQDIAKLALLVEEMIDIEINQGEVFE